MPKFAKGSEEAKLHMQKIREMRNKKINKTHDDESEFENKLIVNQPVISIPKYMVKVETNKQGHINFKLVPTLTKTDKLKTVNKKPIIKLTTNDSNNDIIVDTDTLETIKSNRVRENEDMQYEDELTKYNNYVEKKAIKKAQKRENEDMQYEDELTKYNNYVEKKAIKKAQKKENKKKS